MLELGMFLSKIALASSTIIPIHAVVVLLHILGCGPLPIHA